MLRSIAVAAASASLLLTTSCTATPPDAAPRSPSANSHTQWAVQRVIDGDTIVVSRSEDVGARPVVVRLIGIDTPESVDPSEPLECYAQEASRFAERRLLGQTVRLEYDASQGRRDRYGRTLAYVWLQRPRLLFNHVAIHTGHALEYTYDAPYRWGSSFVRVERAAQRHDIGVWRCPNPGS